MDISSIYDFLNSQASTSIAGFLIIIVSVIAIHYQRKTARQKASLEFLRILSTDTNLIEGSKALKNCHENLDRSMENVATSNGSEYQEIRQNIRPLLNYFEALSIGVRIGIYDKRTVSLSRKKQIIHTFTYSEPYIKNIRDKLKNDCLFENLEWFSACLSKPWYYRLICKITQFFRCQNKKK